MYSVHDTSIISLLCTLGYPVEKWPHFASYVALELYKNKVMSDLLFFYFSVEVKNANQLSLQVVHIDLGDFGFQLGLEYQRLWVKWSCSSVGRVLD